MSSIRQTTTRAEKIVQQLSFVNDIVGFVWIVLTGLMFASIVIIANKESEKRVVKRLALGAVIALIIATWTYSSYAGFDSLTRGLYGNYFYLSLFVFVFSIVAYFYWLPAVLLLPIAVWVINATVYVIAQIRVKENAQ